MFKFNSVQFLLMCWNKESDKIKQNNIVLECQYPYHLMKAEETKAVLPICTDESNYHHFEHIHVRWDGLFEVGLMRNMQVEESLYIRKNMKNEWVKEEQKIITEHPRGEKN